MFRPVVTFRSRSSPATLSATSRPCRSTQAAAAIPRADPQYGITGDQISTIVQQSTYKAGGVTVAQSTLPGFGWRCYDIHHCWGAAFFQCSRRILRRGWFTGFHWGMRCTPDNARGLRRVKWHHNPTGCWNSYRNPAGRRGDHADGESLCRGICRCNDSRHSGDGRIVRVQRRGRSAGRQVHGNGELSNPLLTWTNQNAAATVTRSQGLQVTSAAGPGAPTSVSVEAP